MKKALLFFVFPVILLVVSFCGFLYLFQAHILFESKILPQNFTYDLEGNFEEVFLSINETNAINGLYFKVENPKGAILYLHGKGGNMHYPWGKKARDFTRRGYEVFMIDYRGFGKSRGNCTEQTLLEDVEQAYNYVANNYPEEKIIVYGRSLGTGLAVYVGSKFNPKAIILDSPYISILDLAFRAYPYLPRFVVAFLLKYPLRADLWIEKVKCPIHIFHGLQDKLIPYECSLKLIDKIKQRANLSLTTIKDGGHDLFGSKEYQSRMDELLP